MSSALLTLFKDAVENELTQSKKVQWDASTPRPDQGDELSDEFLDGIDGLPRREESVIHAARLLLQLPTSRYAR